MNAIIMKKLITMLNTFTLLAFTTTSLISCVEEHSKGKKPLKNINMNKMIMKIILIMKKMKIKQKL